MSPSPIEQGPKPLSLLLIWFIVSTMSTIAVWYALEGYQRYGYAMFIGIPISIGLFTSMLYQYGRPWRWGELLLLTLANLGGAAVLVLMCRLEGFACIVMAAFLVAAMTLFGILVAWSVRAITKYAKHRDRLHGLAFLALPVFMHLEASSPPTPPELEQTTSIVVDAPPDVVWQFIRAFPPIEKPPAGWLASGVAYPVASEIDGTGVGATRRCVLSTGSMPEVVTVWEPNKQLEFDVLETPPTMVETNPFGDVHAPHIEGYFQAKRGRFVLTALPDGTTRIDGTSWFVHDLWPQVYWEPVTRHTVSQIHQRVLKHIKALAEESTK